MSTDLCGFAIEIASEFSGREILFFDCSDDLTRSQIHATQQDTFSANGKTLVGEPYTFNVTIEFAPNGDFTRIDLRGVIEKVRLPDGSLFIGAGRTNFLTADSDFVVVPDNGASKNLDRFCAALAG